MAIQLDGISGYLQHNAALVSSYPFTLVAYVACPSPLSGYTIVSQGSTSNDVYNCADVSSFSVNKRAVQRHVGGSRVANYGGAPDVSTSVLLPIIAVFTSANSRTVYFGSATGVTDSTAGTNNSSLLDNFVVGGVSYNNYGISALTRGSVAEAHVYNTALSSIEVGDLVSGAVLPENTAGWVDGWSLKTYNAGGTYTSIGGTRTLTAYGTVSASGLAHPVLRVDPPTLTGNATLGDLTASGDLAPQPDSSMSGTATLDSVTAAGSMEMLPGVITTPVLKNNTGSILANVSGVVANVYNVSTGTPVVRKTGLSSNASGIVTISDAALVPGTSYVYEIDLSAASMGRRLPVGIAA